QKDRRRDERGPIGGGPAATDGRRVADGLLVALNPDPRGSGAAATLVLEAAADLRRGDVIRAGHGNSAAAVQSTPADGEVVRQVLVQTRPTRADALPGTEVRVTIAVSKWNGRSAKWMTARPTVVRWSAPKKMKNGESVGAAFAGWLTKEITDRPAKKTTAAPIPAQFDFARAR
ncbi:MAG: hypothetical protein ACRDD1_10045, partial [Planctomycetia bacterium]